MTSKLFLFGGAFLGLLALLIVLGSADTIHAGTFNPQVRFCFDDFLTLDPNPTEPGDTGECDGDNSGGAASTFATGLEIASGDVNFAGVVTYVPNEWTITPGDEFPVGTRVGLLEAIATIGIINGACDNTLNLVGPVAGFTLYNASLDINDTITFDEEEAGGDEYTQDWAEDLDGNGLLEAVDKYPDFISRIIDDEEGNPQQPFRRSAGHLIIAGADVLIQYLVYEPGTFIDKNLPNDPALGYPTVVLLQNAGDPDLVPEPGPITDFCTPLAATTTSFGTADACDSVVNDDLEDDDLINDGCPTLGILEPASECSGFNNQDEDDDGKINDGCPQVEDSAESGAQCDNADDDDDDGYVNDGCPAEGTPETETYDECANNEDDDILDDLDYSRGIGRGEEARINDGCPQIGDTSETDIEYVLYQNPPEEGSYTITTVAVGQPDADGDGLENYLDNCPFDVNIGDPRVKGDGDLDEDGLDAACDPNDDWLAGGTNSDQDGDGYLNRQDNCPLIANGEDDLDPEGVPLNQEDEDLDEDGDRQIDLIGDVCDPEPLVFNGEPLEERLRTLEVTVEIGAASPDQAPTDGEEDDDGGGGAGVIIIIVIIAAVVIVGGGAFYFMRRRGA